jgi:hypothetical protein
MRPAIIKLNLDMVMSFFRLILILILHLLPNTAHSQIEVLARTVKDAKL